MTLLEISFSDGWGIFIVCVLFFIGVFAFSAYLNLRREKTDFELKFSQQELAYQKIEMDLKDNVNALAIAQFEQFKAVELDSYKKRADEASVNAAQVLLQNWMFENETRIRKDASNRSVRIVLGKVTEHLIPFSADFSDFNPKDARFIGSPIDLIVFDGLEEKKDKVNIIFIEIKTGMSALTKREQVVRDAVKEGRVEWRRINMKDFGAGVNEQLAL